MAYALGVDLGATNIKVVCVTEKGRLLAQRTFATEDSAAATWRERIHGCIREFSRRRKVDASWIGLAAPGLAAADHRSISWMQGRLDAVQGLDWTDALSTRCPIWVLNDAHAALLGEVWKGAARGRRNVVLLVLGTGVGGAVLCDGKLLQGQVLRAGHLGHICLDPDGPPDIVNTPGSLENAIGNCTLAQRSGGRFQDTSDLVKAHLSGDSQATSIWMRSVYLLACGIVSIVNMVDPEVLLLGGGISRAGAALLEPLGDYLEQLEWRPCGHRVKLVQARLEEWAGAYGAARFAISFKDGE